MVLKGDAHKGADNEITRMVFPGSDLDFYPVFLYRAWVPVYPFTFVLVF